ncbi:Transcription initiation factor TFIID subunit 13 [Holothuria leucospilota]|uniref:Transcription initiation factor TFIID subunit 13 n=1 Tax=Holothuria leucospilota TaxID=206669 RepID=A0A9Q1BVB2_HOLLE|nr:Transcription initiation factor TFIID subunit 13 [Holothuria leucospilota]
MADDSDRGEVCSLQYYTEDHGDTEQASASSDADATAESVSEMEKKKRIFSKELRCMMYGFGDDQNPYTESVELLEDLVVEFITEMV